MSKKLLNERQIRRFQKLAEISSINEMDAEATDEAEELEEGGAAARVGNEDRDVGKGRMTADRIREGEGEDLEEADFSMDDEPAGGSWGLEQGHAAKSDKLAGKASAASAAGKGKRATRLTKRAGAQHAAAVSGGGKPGRQAAKDFRRSHNVGKPSVAGRQIDKNLRQDLDEAQMRKLVSRIKARIMQENRHVQRLTHREQQIRLVEAQMARNVERNIAVQNRETLTEALIHRVVNRLRNSKK